MKNIRLTIVLLAGMVVGAAWAQENCHWRGVTQGFYRISGNFSSDIISIFPAEGAFVFENSTTGGLAVVETIRDMGTTNWVRQNHLLMRGVGLYRLVEVSDPACIPRTGQTIDYAVGDDGHLHKGHSWPDPRFTIQEDTSLVVDNLTGLMWPRDASFDVGNWDTAVFDCWHLDRFGHEDWRLPSVRELESLLDMGESLPALPGSHPFLNVATNYWTSTSDSTDTNKAWVVGLQDGHIGRWNRTNGLPTFWPVRSHTAGRAPVPRSGQTNSIRVGDDGHLQGGRAWPVPRFTVMADTNLVFDNLVGRMWPRQLGVGGATNWTGALKRCTDFELGGYEDWRLPNRKELWSLIDYGSPTFLPAGHPFVGAPIAPYWTSTSYAPFPATSAWGGNGGALVVTLKSTDSWAVWPVRGEW